VSHTITLDPETFTLVKFDAGELVALADSAATAVGVPDEIPIAIEVDEALPNPLSASMAWIDDGKIGLWFSGGTFEDPQRQSLLQPDVSKTELAAAFLRARDRLDGGFEDAPPDGELTERQRAIWDVYAEGRVARLDGYTVKEARRRYTYRLRAGFNDVADAEYEQLWGATALTWAQLVEIEERLAAADPRPAAKKPLRNPSLRAS
jgi:hypothetical protein